MFERKTELNLERRGTTDNEKKTTRKFRVNAKPLCIRIVYMVKKISSFNIQHNNANIYISQVLKISNCINILHSRLAKTHLDI